VLADHHAVELREGRLQLPFAQRAFFFVAVRTTPGSRAFGTGAVAVALCIGSRSGHDGFPPGAGRSRARPRLAGLITLTAGGVALTQRVRRRLRRAFGPAGAFARQVALGLAGCALGAQLGSAGLARRSLLAATRTLGALRALAAARSAGRLLRAGRRLRALLTLRALFALFALAAARSAGRLLRTGGRLRALLALRALFALFALLALAGVTR
jgi:hypothetical protein